MSAAEVLAAHTARHCLHVPSNRLGVYLALRHWCTPGQRLLMSALSADEMLFLVLAAGLQPVIAPVSQRDGNIDASRVDLRTVDAVLTTNLYGLPDDPAHYRDKVLIEDAAHALHTCVRGQPVGTFGQAGVYSLSKHAGAGSGGVLAVRTATDLHELRRARELVLEPRALRSELASVAKSMLRLAAMRLDLVRPALSAMRALGMEEPREGLRIALSDPELTKALASPVQPAACDRWISADLREYRRQQGPLVRRYQAHRVLACAATRRRRIDGTALLARLPSAAPAVRDHVDQALFRVPLLVHDRAGAIAALERRGVPVGFVYDPPYDDYAPWFTMPSAYPEEARHWARHVLPVDPLMAERALPIVERLEPAVFLGGAAPAAVYGHSSGAAP